RTCKYGDYTGNPVKEILLKMNLPDHRFIHHDNQKTYNTASATLISNVMIKKSVSMQDRRSQRRIKAILLNKDDQEIIMDDDLKERSKISQA
ncbi:hypothetical protein Tco_0142243, partial [Tanacetum coccineum]